jgi:hypothetical protein
LRIRVLIPLWKRPEVTRFCIGELKKIKSSHEIAVTCVISEDEYEEFCRAEGLDWIRAENDPLGEKMNQGARRALCHEFDYLMVMNSDNVFDSRLLEVYQKFFDKLNPYFGINRITYVDFNTLQARDFVYECAVLGACKCLRRDVVEQALKSGYLYPPEKNRGLDDGLMDNMIHNLGIYPTIVKYEGQLVWDYKSEVNIWPWEFFKDKGTEVEYQGNSHRRQGD